MRGRILPGTLDLQLGSRLGFLVGRVKLAFSDSQGFLPVRKSSWEEASLGTHSPTPVTASFSAAEKIHSNELLHSIKEVDLTEFGAGRVKNKVHDLTAALLELTGDLMTALSTALQALHANMLSDHLDMRRAIILLEHIAKLPIKNYQLGQSCEATDWVRQLVSMALLGRRSSGFDLSYRQGSLSSPFLRTDGQKVLY